MRSTVDSAGRVVLPKALRERLSLAGGTAVEIREREGLIEIEPLATPMHLVEIDGHPVAVPEDELPVLTDEMVRAALEQTRR